MSFTRGQQPEFRTLLERAWQTSCELDSSLDQGARCRKSKRCGECCYCLWYVGLLESSTGHRSTTDCNAGRDYDFVMRALEAIIGDSIKWHMKAAGGDANRIRHELRALSEKHEIDDRYMQRIAKQALRLDSAPALENMKPEQLVTVLIACKQHVTRKLVAEGHRDPQVSRRTRLEKPPQVAAHQQALGMDEPDEEGHPF